jgi:hypothetical protein
MSGDGPMIEVFSGRGLLDARALWASIVGPQRLAMAQRSVARLSAENPALIHKNLGAADSYAFVGVALPARSPMVTLGAIFGRDNSLGDNTGAPSILTRHMGGGGLAVTGFMQLLLPGEQLYAQMSDPAIAPGTIQNVVVAVVQL